jgi:hypothetical protein
VVRDLREPAAVPPYYTSPNIYGSNAQIELRLSLRDYHPPLLGHWERGLVRLTEAPERPSLVGWFA